jgi:hypothetical protein
MDYTARQPTEVDASEMAEMITVKLGFAVTREVVIRAARQRKITTQRPGPGHHRYYFAPEAVLAEIEAGNWRPHHSNRTATGEYSSVWVLCANQDCTKGGQGRRWEGWLPMIREARCRSKSPTCSRECENAIATGRRIKPRTRRRCAGKLEDGSQCPNWIVVTKRQDETGSGAKLCATCKEAGRKTFAQLEAARKNVAKVRNPKAAREARAAASKARGQEVARNLVVERDADGLRRTRRRRRDDEAEGRLESLRAGSLRARATRQRQQIELITAALRANPMASNLAIAREVGRAMGGRQCAPDRVAWLRWHLEDAGEIPHRVWGTKPRKQPAKNPFGPCEYTPAMRERDRKRPNRKPQESTPRVQESRAAVVEAFARLGTLTAVANELGRDIRLIRRLARAAGVAPLKPGRPRK